MHGVTKGVRDVGDALRSFSKEPLGFGCWADALSPRGRLLGLLSSLH